MEQGTPSLKITRLAEAVSAELKGRQSGHCIRIDHLDLIECRQACSELRKVADADVSSFVLGQDEDELHVPVDRAIELRNRKSSRLCIFVPANLQDVAASSLGNSFSAFPLAKFLNATAEELRAALEPSRSIHVENVLSQLRGGARVPIERTIDYLAALHGDDRFEAIGENLWRVGLIPDLRRDEDGFARAVELNRVCVERLVRPLKPQSGLAERIVALKLKPNTIQGPLAHFLEGRRLTSDNRWLVELLSHPELTFDRWEFPDVIPSDLESLSIEPFHEGGRLRPSTGLKQEAPGTVPYAPCGPKFKVKVKWQSEPARPRNVAEWLIEMIPNPDEYPNWDSDAIDLPKKRVKGTSLTATLPLDVGEETREMVRSVVIRVTALDEVGLELKNPSTDDTISDTTQSFYLEERDEEAPAGAKRLATDRCLADAYLKAAMVTRDQELRHVPLDKLEKDLCYLPVQINDRIISRMATTPFLLELESDSVGSYSTPFCFSAIASDVEPLTRAEATSQPCDLSGIVDDKVWKEFISARRRVFDHIKGQKCLSVCALRFTKEVCDAVVRLAKAYTAVCDEVLSLCESEPNRFNEASNILATLDTLDIHFPGRPGAERVTVHLGTHPARLLWLAAYSEWVHSIVDSVLRSPSKARRKLFDPSILQNVAPDNVPAWTVRPGSPPSVFVDNLHFVYGVSLPVETADPATLFSETAWALGFGEAESRLTSIEGPRLADQIRRYRSLHPYTSTFRVAAVNTGNGSFLTSALLDAMRPKEGEETEEQMPQLDLIHCLRKEDAMPRAEAERFLAEWQRSSLAVRGDQLRPSVQIALTRLDIDKGLPGDDVHLTTMLDGHTTNLVLHHPLSRPKDSKLYGAGSLALFGLITKLETEFSTQEGSACWWHRLALSGPQNAGEHPVRPAYTKLLQDLHEGHLALTGATLAGGVAQELAPALCTEVSHEGMQTMSFFHDVSDWVLSVDRHFGIEFFDSPNDVHLGRNSQRYLLDYVPEFIEGMGHRQIMTTNWIEEVSQIMQGAMAQLGLSGDASNCVRLLAILKSLSGRLALRLVSEDSLAQETVGLAMAMAYLESRGDLTDAIVVPLDAHKDFFLQAKKNEQVETASRCDILIIRGIKNRIKIDFLEVKSRQGMTTPSEELLDKIADQTNRTELLFRSVFFAEEPRMDQSIYLCRLASILRFYLNRAQRHGRIGSQDSYENLLDAIGRLETGQAKLISNLRGIIINIGGPPIRPISHKGASIIVLTGPDIEKSTGLAILESVTDPAATTESFTHEDQSHIVEEIDLPTLAEEDAPQPIVTVNTAATVTAELRIDLGLDARTEMPVEYIGTVSGSPHLFILGIPGQGKSWTMQRVVSESARQGIPSIILDFHGQFANSSGTIGSSAKPLVFDASCGLPFSPFEAGSGSGTRNWKTNAFQVAEIIQHVCDLGEMQRDVIYESIRDAYIACEFETDARQIPTMSDVFSRLQKREEERKGVRNTTARCRALFEFDLFAESPEKTFSFSDAYQSGLVVDLHLLGLEVLQNAAGSFVLRKLYKDMFTWGESEKLRLMIVLDEAHRLAKDVTLPKIMKEGRKFGLAVVVASQSMQDFHPEVLENAGTKIAFRLNHPQNKLASAFFRSRPHGEDISAMLSSLGVGQALVQTPSMQYASKTLMTPLQ